MSGAPIAQLVELRTFNPQVVGSSPTGGTYRGRVTRSETHDAGHRPAAIVRVLCPDGTTRVEPTIADALAGAADDDVVWVDLSDPAAEDLDEVARRLGPGIDLHPLLREDVFDTRRRPKIDRFDDHVFLDLVDVATRPAAEVDPEWFSGRNVVQLPGGEVLTVDAISAIVFDRRVITVRAGACSLDLEVVDRRWREAGRSRRDGPGLIVHSLLDLVVDHLVEVTTMLDADVDEVEQLVVETGASRSVVQGRAFMLRKATSLVRRVAMPTREVVGQVLRRDGRGFLTDHVADDNIPYLHDVNDHVVRVSETLDALRDELTSILELNMSLQDTELNQVMKKLSAWAAVIAVPTAVTGYFGQNVPYPGYDSTAGFVVSSVVPSVPSSVEVESSSESASGPYSLLVPGETV